MRQFLNVTFFFRRLVLSSFMVWKTDEWEKFYCFSYVKNSEYMKQCKYKINMYILSLLREGYRKSIQCDCVLRWKRESMLIWCILDKCGCKRREEKVERNLRDSNDFLQAICAYNKVRVSYNQFGQIVCLSDWERRTRR